MYKVKIVKWKASGLFSFKVLKDGYSIHASRDRWPDKDAARAAGERWVARETL